VYALGFVGNSNVVSETFTCCGKGLFYLKTFTKRGKGLFHFMKRKGEDNRKGK
jgi:hypothetical protein